MLYQSFGKTKFINKKLRDYCLESTLASISKKNNKNIKNNKALLDFRNINYDSNEDNIVRELIVTNDDNKDPSKTPFLNILIIIGITSFFYRFFISKK